MALPWFGLDQRRWGARAWFFLLFALGSGCTAHAEAPPAAGPPPPDLRIADGEDAQGEAEPAPPPASPAPAQTPTPPSAPPPPPAEATAQPVQPASPPEPVVQPAAPPPAAPVVAPVVEPAPASGQWIYTSQYGWLWLPYARAYTYVSPDGGVAYEYAYYPSAGWRWVYSPWVLGWGPAPYWGRLGPRHYVWYSRPWFRVGIVHRGPIYHRRWHRRW